MKSYYALLLILFGFNCYSQITLKGKVIDLDSGEALSEVKISIEGTAFELFTDTDGNFDFLSFDLPFGEQIIEVSKETYISQRIFVVIQQGTQIDLNPILLELDLLAMQSQISLIDASDLELDGDESISFSVAGLLQSSKDIFLNAAAYDFSSTFFRPRGLDSEYNKVLINGLEMIDFYTFRPQWSNWGGLNDLQRNQDSKIGLHANDQSFADLGSTVNFEMRASKYKQGGRVSFSSANRSYTTRLMGSYATGVSKKGWSFAALGSRRAGKEGFVEGTLYDANSFLLSVEKKLSDTHSINLTAVYTPNRRGRGTAITKEVKDLKGVSYNPNWGYQNGLKRNVRIREVKEPFAILGHYWKINKNTNVQTNISFQDGSTINSRLDSGGNRNPAPNYYQRLPSYFLRTNDPSPYDFQLAYLAEQDFINNGQLNWLDLYNANKNTSSGLSKYIIQNDRTDNSLIAVNSLMNSILSEKFSLSGSLEYRTLNSKNYAEVADLLGGNGYLDIDIFGDDPLKIQSDLQNPDRIVNEGDSFRYNFEMITDHFSGFTQLQVNLGKWETYFGVSAASTNYHRIGNYQNGYFPEQNRSLGKSEPLNFLTFGSKLGVRYSFNGKHIIDLNLGYLTKPPSLRQSFANPRQNNDLVEGLAPKKIQNLDLGYIYRSPTLNARLTGYYITFQDETDVGFYFTQNALGNDETTAFVQEIVTDIEKQNIGLEFGLEVKVLPTFTLKAVAALGQFIYTNNPMLYLSSDDFNDPNTLEVEGNDLFKLGKREVDITNYHVPSGPERAYQLGFEYRDPEFWWVGISANYFSNAYADISFLRRTPDFYTDQDGLPYPEYDPEVAKLLLKQEEFNDYVLLNIVGGKSWRVKDYFVGVFASINNLLNTENITGGFEDSRRSSFRQQIEEKNRSYGPLFGNRYFFGYGLTYFANLYIRF